MAFSAGSVFVTLFGKFERHDFEQYEKAVGVAQRHKAVQTQLQGDFDARGFKQYEDALQRSRKLAEQRSKFKAALGADFDNRAFREYSRATQQAERETSSLTRSQKGLSSSMLAIGGRAGSALAAVGGLYALVNAVKSVTSAYGEAEVSQRKMQAQLRASGISFAAHAKEIDKVIQKVSQLAGLDDEKLQDAFTNIVRVTGSVNQSLRLVGLAADFARAKNLDVAKAGEILGKVAGGNTGILQRYGLSFYKATNAQDALRQSTKNATAEQKAAAKAVDDTQNAQAALALLQRKFGGQAEAYGRTQQGSIDRVKVAFENLRETFGRRLAPALTDAANRLADFINGMQTGTGAGGQFARVMRSLAGAFKDLAREGGEVVQSVRSMADRLIGLFTGIIDAEGAVARLTGKLIPGRDAMDKFADRASIASDRLNKLRERIDPAEHGMDILRRSANDLAVSLGDHVAGGAHRAEVSLSTSLARAASSGKSQFHGLQVAVDRSLDHINTAVAKELKTYGSAIKIDASFGSRAPGAGHAGGGWIGDRGMVGQDIVPAILAPGEAVLNRHQQAVIEALLGQGFLDQLFAHVQRPHFMAGGGFAGMAAAASQVDRAHFPYRWGGGHQATPAPFGPFDCSGAVSYVLQHGGVDIPTMTSGQLAGAGSPGPGPVTVFANPTHTFMRLGSRYFGTSGSNPGGGAGFFPAPGAGYLSRFTQRHFGAGDSIFPSLNVRVGGSGPLAGIARAALGLSARAANAFMRRRIGGFGLGTGDVGDPGPGITGKVSTFGPPTEPAGRTATGVSSSLPGIALFQRSTLGKMFDVTVGGHHAALKQTDIGPAPWTGRKIDVTGAGSSVLGINPRHFPTDSIGTATPLFSRGGLIQRFAKGGRIRGLKKLQGQRIADYDGWIDRIDTLSKQYDQKERLYNVSEEVLVRDDGTVDEVAVKKRALELAKLSGVENQILDALHFALTIAKRVVTTYRTIITRLTTSLKHAKGKDRSGIRSQISNYRGELSDWKDKVKDLGFQIGDEEIDRLELGKEYASVVGTQPDIQDTTDTGPGDTTPEPPGTIDTGPSPDDQAQVSQLIDRLRNLTEGARINAAALAAFASPGDIGTGGQFAITAAGGTVASAPPIAGAIDAAGQQAVTIVNNFNSVHPGTPDIQRAVADMTVSGIGLQASRSTSTATLGI